MSGEKKANYETIEPPHTLRSKVRVLSGRDAQFDPVEKAEAAVERLSTNFADWMTEEVDRLGERWAVGKSSGFNQQSRQALYRTAHDIRGQAGTFGYPHIGAIAGTFCDILEGLEDQPVPDEVLEQFISAIRAIIRETERNQSNVVADQLTEELKVASGEILKQYA